MAPEPHEDPAAHPAPVAAAAHPAPNSPPPALENQAEALLRFVEAVLFVAEGPMPPDEITQALHRAGKTQADDDNVTEALRLLDAELITDHNRIYRLEHIAGGYQLLTKPEFGAVAKAAVLNRDQKKLSKAALETLAVVAYRQPVTKAEMEFIRGVSCDYALQKLLEKQLVEPAGRADLPGKPLLYRTTPFFMEYFGLRTLADLPQLSEISPHEELQKLQDLQDLGPRLQEPAPDAPPQ